MRIRWNPRAGLAALLALSMLQGCNESEQPPAVDGSRIVHQHRDPRFELRLETNEQTAPGRLRAEIVPRGDYHLSTEYPSRLELHGQGMTVQPAILKRDEATELSGERVSFELDVRSEGAPPQHLTGTLRFGVCLRDELCEPVSHDFEADLF